jgi:hypothetical protein
MITLMKSICIVSSLTHVLVSWLAFMTSHPLLLHHSHPPIANIITHILTTHDTQSNSSFNHHFISTLLVVQARLPFPIKFNGQLFTSNKPKSEGGSGVDSRDWGGLSWWQVRTAYCYYFRHF